MSTRAIPPVVPAVVPPAANPNPVAAGPSLASVFQKPSGLGPRPVRRTAIPETQTMTFSNHPLTENNPLLQFKGPPQFSKIKPHHAVPAIQKLADEFIRGFEKLEQTLARNPNATFDDIFLPLNQLGRNLTYAARQAGHLADVVGNEEWSTANETIEKISTDLSLRENQSQVLYIAIRDLKASPQWYQMDEAQRRIIDTKLKSMEDSGLSLSADQKERFNAIEQELTTLSNRFRKNATDSKDAFELIITDKSELSGVSPENLARLAEAYNKRKKIPEDSPDRATGENGPWFVGLSDWIYSGSILVPGIIDLCENSTLKEKLFQARRNIAANADFDGGKFNNTEIINQTLKLKQEKARLLGYKTYADMSLSRKMAGKVEAADDLMNQLLSAAQLAGQKEDTELQKFAEDHGYVGPLKAWDKPLYADKLRNAQYNVSDDLIKQYLNLPLALKGVATILEQLFNVTIQDASSTVPLYTQDMYYYRVLNSAGKEIASFYFDPYERSGLKRSGAWMNDLKTYRVDDSGRVVEKPIALLTCNIEAPANGKPARLSMGQLETLVHELGHGLQHMLTTVPYENAAGISNVEWDAVEVASQFMEYWVYQPEFLKKYSQHETTGEPLSDELIQKINTAKNFWSANSTLRQLVFGMTDMELHARLDLSDNKRTAYDAYNEIHQKIFGKPADANDHFLNNFSHIFAGGYSAGYYGYAWAETLAADYFSAFEPFLNDPAAVRVIGERLLKTLYEMGGGVHPRDVFRAFMGRDYNIDALLRHKGLKQS